MSDEDPSPVPGFTWIGSSVVRGTFAIGRRGTVITLEDNGAGEVVGPTGLIRGKAGSCEFKGPEIVDERPFAWIAVIVAAPDAISIFHPGDRVDFFKFDPDQNAAPQHFPTSE